MLKLKKIKLVLRCLCLLWGESGKPTDLLFLGKTPCPELPTHLPGLKICICSDIHWKILPDILLALVSLMERRELHVSLWIEVNVAAFCKFWRVPSQTFMIWFGTSKNKIWTKQVSITGCFQTDTGCLS